MTNGRSVLLLEPPFGASVRDACIEHLIEPDEPTAVLSVLYSEPVADRMALIERHSDEIDSAAIICVGPTGDANGTDYADHDAVRVISDPADLTGLGIAITNWLESRSDEQVPTVCLDSVSMLLQYVEHERALKFLHTVTSRFRRTGVRSHCHLDPRAHDEQVVAQLRQVFDEQRRIEGAAAADASGDASAQQPVATDGGLSTTGDERDPPAEDRTAPSDDDTQ